MELILASQSPRRKALLALFGRPFTVRVAHIDEAMDPAQPPEAEAARVSLAKARAVRREKDDIVVAADTIVVCGERVLGKPKDPAQAAEMLTLLSGREHRVVTGLTVLRGDTVVNTAQTTFLRFRPLDPGEIAAYVRSGEPMDKAGAYGIQGGAALFVEEIRGDYYNVMGLPVCELAKILWRVAPEYMKEAL